MRDAPDRLMIFAAGFGTRMGALTRDRPKPMVPLAGRPLIDHALEIANDAAMRRVVVNSHYHADILHAHLAETDARISHERPEILDTGGGLKAAGYLLDADTVLTLNPDVAWQGPNPLTALRAAWDPDRMSALLLLIPPERRRGTSGDGDFALGADGRLSRGGPLTYTGAQIIDTRCLAPFDGAFSLNPVWDQIAAGGQLHGLVYTGTWCDAGHPDGLHEAEAMLAGG